MAGVLERRHLKLLAVKVLCEHSSGELFEVCGLIENT